MVKRVVFLFISLLLLQAVSMCSRICSFSPLSADIQINKSIKLILQFDINKTIIAEDMLMDKDKQYTIAHELADTVMYEWGGGQVMSYLDYVEKVLYPSKTDEFKQIIRELIRGFPTTLAQSDHPEKERYLGLYDKAIEKMRDVYLIPSFVKLMKALQQEGANFKLVLRTFGGDIRVGKVTEAVNALFQQEAITPAGTFVGDDLVLSTGQTLTSFQQIDQFIKGGQGHIALQEDGLRWIQDDKKRRSGKKIIIDSSDQETMPLFFDDNINSDPESEYGIAQPVTIEGKPLSMQEQLYNHLFPVEMLKAIIDDDYYIDMIKKRLLLP